MVRWTLISLRRAGFARGALRRGSDRGEVCVLLAGVLLTAAAVPVGAQVEEWLLGTLVPDQAAMVAVAAVMVWTLLVSVAFRVLSATLERRRIDAWGNEWRECQ
ncbi:hypothetical protein JOF56_005521 [Kibdelosporangium banguiense]|uniref:Uncharacterized protein n=1 Tax=Kibdelosporangium banguiense TaxID=1365924 RepID=A0ABS4TML8_9PSEU|nr:hypothetical protein [Kibdelosporangium banguiense]MBP2325136.1 hypothetical protein [Kibdelosporangium banguiense]